MTSVASWRGDFAASSLPQLMEMLARGDPDGAPIAGRPQALSIWVYSSGFNATLTADLRGAQGRPITATFGRLPGVFVPPRRLHAASAPALAFDSVASGSLVSQRFMNATSG